jgi:hypothetical protein
VAVVENDKTKFEPDFTAVREPGGLVSAGAGLTKVASQSNAMARAQGKIVFITLRKRRPHAN